MERFVGNGCAPGCAEGTVLVKKDAPQTWSMEPAADTEAELRALDEALQTLSARMDELYEQVLAEAGQEAAELIETYQMILLDTAFFDSIRGAIREQRLACAAAIRQESERSRATFEAMADPYMRERFTDIQAVCAELIALCTHTAPSLLGVQLAKPTVIVADSLTPVDTLRLDKQYLKGFVTESGGATSHVVVLARTLGIPAVVGVADITGAAQNGMEILVSGDSGEVTLEPDAAARAAFLAGRHKQEQERARYNAEPLGEARTLDGKRILLAVNAGDADTADRLDPGICDGVGLFRTEFLYMAQPGYPDEETLFAAYRDAIQKMAGREFIFRSLDIGGDKALPYMGLPQEENPFLGYRAVRICLDRPALFKTQLRAILRASAFGRAKLMFPMITCLDELRACKEVLEQCKEELRGQGVSFDEKLPVGIMVETPASVFVLDQLAAESDFFSIGTNDLTQYLMAADRGNPKVQALYDPFQISVLRALRHIGAVAGQYGVPVGVCGEAAASPELIPFLVGCGVSELSMSAPALARARWIVRRLDARDCAALAERVLSLGGAGEAKAALKAYVEAL